MRTTVDLGILKSATGEAEADTAPPPRTKLTLRKPDSILAMVFDDSDIILGDRLFAKGQSLVIAGQGGLGKSRLILQIAASVISGGKCLVFDSAGSHLRWLILQTQNSNRRLKDDFKRLKVWLSVEDWQRFNEQVTIHTLENDEDGFVSLDSLDNQIGIETAILDTEPDIVVIDPLDEFGIGDLNKDTDMKATLQLLSRICRKGNPQRGIVVLHHAITGRSGAAKATGYDRASFARNSKSLHAWTRGQINLVSFDEDNYDRLVVACGKCSNGREFQPFAIRLNPDTMIYECDPTANVKEWASGINGRDRNGPPTPTTTEFLSIFRTDPENPRSCLMSAVELREKFKLKKWAKESAPALRDECEGTGKLKVYHGPKNQKLAGLPGMVDAFAKQQNEAGSIREQVPLMTKSKCTKRKR